MKLFKFLKMLEHENLQFRLEYEGYSNSIKVIVDTFMNYEIYTFNKNGITNFLELQEVKDTEDINYIKHKIENLKDRSLKAWKTASKDLGIEFIHPYIFKGIDGEEYEAVGLLPDFGNGKGVILTDRKTSDDVFFMANLMNDFHITLLIPRYYEVYDRERFIQTLSDWGWIGTESQKPDWLIEN